MPKLSIKQWLVFTLRFPVGDDKLSPWHTHSSSFSESLRTPACSPDLQLYEYDNASYHCLDPIFLRRTSNLHITALCNVFLMNMHMWACVCKEEDLHIQMFTAVTCWPAPTRISTRSKQHNMFYSCQHVCPSMHYNIRWKGYNVYTWNVMWCCVLKENSGLNTRYK